MYIKVYKMWDNCWCYRVFAENHKAILDSYLCATSRWAAVRAAKKMAKKLNIEYREN